MCIQHEAVTVVEAAATYPDFTFPLCTAALWHLDGLHFLFFVRIHFNSNAGVYIESCRGSKERPAECSQDISTLQKTIDPCGIKNLFFWAQVLASPKFTCCGGIFTV